MEDKTTKLKRNPIYKEPRFIKEIIKLVKIYNNYDFVAREINKRFDTTISGKHVKTIYFDNTAEAVIQLGKSQEIYEENFQKLKERWNDAWNIVGWLIDSAKKAKKEIDTAGDTKSAFVFLKLAPTLIQITKEVREQLEFIKKQQDQMKEVQGNLIYSPIQINNIMVKHLEQWEEKGYIKFLRPIQEMQELKVTQTNKNKSKKEVNNG